MTNHPHRDLDQSDVDADADRMKDEMIADLLAPLDGADLIAVFACIAASTGDDFSTLLDSSLGREILQSTQSDPSLAHARLLEVAEILDL